MSLRIFKKNKFERAFSLAGFWWHFPKSKSVVKQFPICKYRPFKCRSKLVPDTRNKYQEDILDHFKLEFPIINEVIRNKYSDSTYTCHFIKHADGVERAYTDLGSALTITEGRLILYIL